MGSVSTDLKTEREKRNISLAQIAAETRISLRHLESLEEGRFDDLPGGLYTKAFLRAYCEAVNLDFQKIVQRFEAELPPQSEKSPKSGISVNDRTFSLNSVVLWALMVVISAVGIFSSRQWIASVFSPYFTRQQSNTIPSLRPQEKIAPVTQDVPAPAAAVEVAPPKISQPPAAPPPVQSQRLRLEIGATEKCWISVDLDGAPAIRKILEPGENQSFDAAEQFSLVVGNAGGIHLKINGRPAKPLGKSGEVVRIVIDERSLHDLIGQDAG